MAMYTHEMIMYISWYNYSVYLRVCLRKVPIPTVPHVHTYILTRMQMQAPAYLALNYVWLRASIATPTGRSCELLRHPWMQRVHFGLERVRKSGRHVINSDQQFAGRIEAASHRQRRCGSWSGSNPMRLAFSSGLAFPKGLGG
jgi:hypothetical protein